MAVPGETDSRGGEGGEEGGEEQNWDTKNIEEDADEATREAQHSFTKSSVQNDHDASVKFNCFFANSRR